MFLGGCDLPQLWRSATQVTIGELGFGTGLNVLALQHQEAFETNPDPNTRLAEGTELVAIGSPQQRELFYELFQNGKGHSNGKGGGKRRSLPVPPLVSSKPPGLSDDDDETA